MPNATPIHVACLCAAWCRLCDDYRAVLESLADELDRGGVSVHWHWVDIEDEADLIGDLDVETFPTVVVADQANVRFAGVVTPQREVLLRLLRATVMNASPDAGWPAVTPVVQALAEGLRQRAPDRAARASKSA
ncbi:MAG: thioredoxin domain-containing protein [Burkholderiales bacterium]|jgi:thioredoxin-like negative regulator of GroEL